METALPHKEYPFIINKSGLEGKYILSSYACAKLLLVLQEEGLLKREGEKHEQKSLKESLAFIEKYDLLFMEMLNMLKKNGYIERNEKNIVTTEKVTHISQVLEDLHKEIEQQQFKDEGKSTLSVITPYIKLMKSVFPSFLKVARGEMSYLSALFPHGDKTLVESIYKTNTQALFNKLIVHYSNEIVNRLKGTKETIHILEIGAGTGGTTASVLSLLKEQGVSVAYYYTDISAGMVRIGKSQFKDDYDFIHYKPLNIDKNPEDQGFELGNFDFILCSNVLHATYDIERTLANIRKLMAPSNAYLLINEIIDKLDFLTVTFGLTDGWWKYADEHRKAHAPVLDIPTWKKLLTDLGLTQGISVEKVEEISDLTSQNLFIYKS